MEDPQAQNYVVLLLKIVPLLFSIAYKGLNLDFYDYWSQNWSSYKDEMGYNINNNEEEEWRYHVLSVYLHDKKIFNSSLVYSFILATALHFLLFVQQNATILAIPLILYGILACLVRSITESFFKIDAGDRNPDNYETYYYAKKSTGSAVKSAYKNRLFRCLDQRLSPTRVLILIDIVILVNIGLLEALLVLQISIPFSNRISVFSSTEFFALVVSISSIILTLMLIFSLFPFNRIE